MLRDQVAWVRDGYVDCNPWIRVYDGPSDNPGTDNVTIVDACGSACYGKFTPTDGTWDWDADGISVDTEEGSTQRGRCYCVRLDPTLCYYHGTTTTNRWQTFAFVPPTPAPAPSDNPVA